MGIYLAQVGNSAIGGGHIDIVPFTRVEDL